MTGRDDRDTADLLDELETTLEALRADLDGDERGRRRPPTPRDLLRVTEEYTIPTVVAALEAAIAALELLRAVLRLADPDRSLAGDDGVGIGVGGGRGPAADAVGRAGGSAVAGAERALSELRHALAGTDLPEESAARDLVDDARELSAEVEARLGEARADPGGHGRATDTGTGGDDGAVRIEVGSGDADGAPERTDEAADDPDGTGVDVDAELDSIRREVREEGEEGEGEAESGSTERTDAAADDRPNGDGEG